MVLHALVVGWVAGPTGGGIAPAVDTVGVVAGRLAAPLGRRIEVEPSLKRIPVLVDPAGMGPARTLEALAFALRATLSRDGERLRLSRTSADQKAMRASRAGGNRERIAAGLAVWDRILKRADSLGDAAAQVKRARSDVSQTLRESQEAVNARRAYSPPADLMGENMVAPAGRLLRSLLGRVGLDRLADLGSGECRFYSDHPNAVESPLPSRGDLVDAYVRSRCLYTAAMGLPEAPGTSAKAILRTDARGASLALYNRRGQRLDEGWIGYDMKTVVTPALDAMADDGAAAKWIDLDEPSRRWAALLKGIGPAPQPLPDEYLYPERHDPLGFAVRVGVLAARREAGAKPLVAVLSDGLLRPALESVRDGRLNVSSFERLVFGRDGYERVAQGGATVVRPRDEIEAEAGLAEREVLGREIRRIVADRDINLRNWCALHLALYKEAGGPVTYRYVGLLERLGFRAFPDFNSRPPGQYALCGALLRRGGPVVNGDVPHVAGLLRDGIAWHWLAFKGGPQTPDLALAPSSLLAARDRKVAFGAAETPVARPYGGAVEEARRLPFIGLEAEALGSSAIFPLAALPKGSRTEARTKRGIESAVLNVSYQYGRRTTLGADVFLEGGLRSRIELQDTIADRDGLRFADLPKAFQEGVMKGVRDRLAHGPDNGPAPDDRGIPPANGAP